MKPIKEVAAELGLSEKDMELYGNYKAKISLDIPARLKNREKGKYIVVTAITPTPLGEGKTTTSIGLAMGLSRLGKKTIAVLRQPSMGPVFGIKGGGTGGGKARLEPMEDININFTGDIHAVGQAHNLLAAFVDNHLYHGNKLNIDPRTISWPRVVDTSDRALREVKIACGRKDGPERHSSFDITVASEVMAILALARNWGDLRIRLGKIVVALTKDGKPVTAEDLKVAGSMAAILRDALKPNLVQTTEETPALVHAGPFGNIAHGCSSVLADEIALQMSDFIITEAGFGADLGLEKFINIKCRISGLKPDAVVIVATVRSLKMHGGVGAGKVRPGKPLPSELLEENLPALEKGMENLKAMIDIARRFGLLVAVAINRFANDTQKEINLIKKMALEHGAEAAEESSHFEKGGRGAEKLARAVVKISVGKNHLRLTYKDEDKPEEKIKSIAEKIYGAGKVKFSSLAEKKILWLKKYKYGHLPICIAKTHLSLSHNPKLTGRPTGFTFPVRDIRLSAGAGFIYVLAGDIRTMPGLPSHPAGENIDIDDNGKITGVF